MVDGGPDSRTFAGKLVSLPILPLRNSVLFPTSVVPINVGRPRSVRLVQDLLGQERALVGVVSQKSSNVDEPTFEDLFDVGTLARVVKVIRLGPSNYSVVLNGLARVRLAGDLLLEPYMRARVERLEETRTRDVELEALGATLRESTREVLSLMPHLPRDTATILDHVREPGALADLIAANFPPSQVSVVDKQRVLEAADVKRRLKLVLGLVAPQLEVLRVKQEISSMVEEEMTKGQREQVLRQQMSSIKQQLGEADDEDEIEELRERVRKARPPVEVAAVAKKQLSRLAGMAPQSAEYNVTRTYIEWIADLPWSKTTEDKFDIGKVRRCLDEDHRGLERIKKRIVEYAAVRQIRSDMKGPILCFVGPPGVGKTSLGRSIARAMGRAYERISLGGVRDEAEIRGHRRTYVGALPGRIIQALKRAGTKNPVLVLDEVEKMGMDLRGDPASALLEVLDPAQNDSFRDHYMELAFDLSQVLFIATANQLEPIAPALQDRMEIIELPGYTRAEKIAIAREFLVPKQLQSHGMTDEQLDFTPEGVAAIVDHYTREAGVRGLEREVGSLCRAAAVKLADGQDVHDVVTVDHVEAVLGPHRYRPENADPVMRPGVATGLFSTDEGGQLLFVEASKMPGKGRIVLTGNMRNVMQESAQAAVSYVRSKASHLHLDPEWLRDIDLHVHIPSHGVPKDGSSAGVAMFAAVASLLLDCPLRSDVAMTGELCLRGRVLAVDGLPQKLLAAHRAGIKQVLVPERNRNDVLEIPPEVVSDIDVRYVSSLDEVLPLVLADPSARPASRGGAGGGPGGSGGERDDDPALGHVEAP
ncbi:MAG: endopeptidase La [Polyangiaceae bacterium]|nr:endopeptidase La [Polyangiaceae bacterium]